MLFRQLFDAQSSSYTYLLADDAGEAVIVDPVLDQLERDLELVTQLGLTLRFALDTHVHADHVTAVGALRERTGCRSVLSERAGTGWADVLVKHGDHVRFGTHALQVRETPGHTDGCLTFVIDKIAFSGDALLVRGCGRTDFQQGNARTLYRSVHEHIFTLPEDTLVYPAHDYRGRTVTTVGEEKRFNPRLRLSEDEFVAFMRELALAPPAKIDVALPANLQGGVARSVSFDPMQNWAPIGISPSGTPELSPQWLAAHADEVRIVDVREPDELAGELGHIAGAELVPLAMLIDSARDWDRDAPLVLVCRSGGRSAKGALELRAQGFSRVASMRGGMSAWRELRLPVER